MRQQYSFLSPANINFVILKLRGIYPENVHADIRENVPYIAHDWFYTTAVNVEQQFVGGTPALNQAFMNFLLMTKRFMPNEREINPSYTTTPIDPYIQNQPFQNVINDMIYPSQANEYNARKLSIFNGINRELAEADIGGLPLNGNLTETTMGSLATEISRNRVRQPKASTLTWGVKHQCNDNFTACEFPAIPRAKFTLPRDYYESPPAAGYWMGMQPCDVQKNNPKMSEYYIQNVYNYPNAAYYRKDIIPAIRSPVYGNDMSAPAKPAYIRHL